MTNKEKYRALCLHEESIPLFSQAWWLDSTADESGWDVILAEENGEIVAALPYVKKKRYGFTIITQPVLTQSLGPWVRPSLAKYSRQLGIQKNRIQCLLSQLPKFDHYQQNWSPDISNWLPAYWCGFNQTTRYTYVVSGLQDLDKVLSRFDSSYRNKINKATKIVSVKHDLGIDRFFLINLLTFSRQGMKIPYSLEFLRKHDDILGNNGKRKIFFAEDSDGKIHSALYLAWDARSSYVHMVGEDPALRNSGAGVFLIWEAIKFTAQELKLDRFDFEGSMLENVEPVRRDCGGVQTPYFTITKTPNRLLRTAMFLRELRA